MNIEYTDETNWKRQFKKQLTKRAFNLIYMEYEFDKHTQQSLEWNASLAIYLKSYDQCEFLHMEQTSSVVQTDLEKKLKSVFRVFASMAITKWICVYSNELGDLSCIKHSMHKNQTLIIKNTHVVYILYFAQLLNSLIIAPRSRNAS